MPAQCPNSPTLPERSKNYKEWFAFYGQPILSGDDMNIIQVGRPAVSRYSKPEILPARSRNQSWGARLPVCWDGTEAGWLHAPPPYGREEAPMQLVWFAWVVIGAVIDVSWFLVIFNFFFILSCMTFQYIQLLCKPVPGEQDPVSSFLFWMVQILPHTYSSPIYSR